MKRWRDWWHTLSGWQQLWPVLAGSSYLGVLLAMGMLGPRQTALIGVLLGLHYAAPWVPTGRRLLVPLLLMLLVYDGQRFWVNDLRGQVHVGDLQGWELAWFGIDEAGGRVTPAQWWQTRTHPVVDLVTGVAYLVYLPVFMLSAWWWDRTGRPTKRVMGAFLLLHLGAFAVYVLFPAAPPWYVQIHGPGPAVLDAAPDAAGAARFDALVGLPVFARYYAQSANVFGAMPSLHAAVPFLALLFALKFRSLRAATALVFLTVAFAAVYLNHHYVLDVLAGMALALGAFGTGITVRS